MGISAFSQPRIQAALAIIVVLLAAPKVSGSIPTPAEMENVCKNWLALTVSQRGAWAASAKPEVTSVSDIREGDTLLARCYLISPNGFVVVPALKELPPVNAYSEVSRLDVSDAGGMARLIKDVLLERVRAFAHTYGSLDAMQPSVGPVLLGREHTVQWTSYSSDPGAFALRAAKGFFAPVTEGVPLLKSSWGQSYPYNLLCPMGDGGQCVVGCVATAGAQVLKYWSWPPHGAGAEDYWWNGDYSCDGSTPGQELSAVFSDTYDWSNMPDSCDAGCTELQRAALAELCSEVGIGVNMGYGVCASGAFTSDLLPLFRDHFLYDAAIHVEDRAAYSLEAWFDLIRNEIEARRPMVYRVSGHAIVCDGWRIQGGVNQYGLVLISLTPCYWV